MKVQSIDVPSLPPFVDKAELAQSGAPFYVTAVEHDSYQGKAQHRLTLTDANGEEPVTLTLGGGGSRDAAVALIREALANGAEGCGPFVLTTFPTTFGKPGYTLSNAPA